jgi:hypothetical protein
MILYGLKYLHTECQVIYAGSSLDFHDRDITLIRRGYKTGNMMIKVGDPSILEVLLEINTSILCHERTA